MTEDRGRRLISRASRHGAHYSPPPPPSDVIVSWRRGRHSRPISVMPPGWCLAAFSAPNWEVSAGRRFRQDAKLEMARFIWNVGHYKAIRHYGDVWWSVGVSLAANYWGGSLELRSCVRIANGRRYRRAVPLSLSAFKLAAKPFSWALSYWSLSQSSTPSTLCSSALIHASSTPCCHLLTSWD